MCEYRVTDKWHIQINDQEMTLSLSLITLYLNGHDATGGANFKTRPRLFYLKINETSGHFGKTDVDSKLSKIVQKCKINNLLTISEFKN